MNTNHPQAGWYADPSDVSLERYWDGGSWSDSIRPAAPASVGYATPPPPMPYSGETARTSTSNGFSIAGIILGAIAFLILPIVFGPLGLVMGAVAKSKGEPLANRALWVAGIGLIAGMLMGALVFASL